MYSYLAQYYGFIENDYEKGLEYTDQFLEVSEFKDEGYYIKGILYANLLEQDSIRKYIDKMNDISFSPEKEADIWASYYGKNGDVGLFIKYAQRSIDYGFPLASYLSEPPYSDYIDNVDFQEFLRTNGIEYSD